MPDPVSAAQEPTGRAAKPAQSKAADKATPPANASAPILLRKSLPTPSTANLPAATPGAPEPLGQTGGPAQSPPPDREAEASAEAASFLAGKDGSETPNPAAQVENPPAMPETPSAALEPASAVAEPSIRAAETPGSEAATAGATAAEPDAIVVPTAPGQSGAMQVMVAAEVLRRVNRTRQVVSLVSQVIIRSYEEEALHAEVCRHLVTFGGYLMAWVGLAEEEPERIVRPVAHAGLEANFLHALKITWSNDLANLSPTSRAIQEQRPHVARNIPKEPRFAVLRDDAQLYGYTATCALPLQFAQYGLGVLTIHAAEPDAFGPEEVSLLRELANDLAAGVIGLRERAVRERLEEETRKAEERYRSIIDNAREGIFQSTADGKLLMVNIALVRLLGYASKEELLAVQPPVILTHIHPDDSKAAVEGMFVADGAEPYEARMRRKVGGWIWVGVIAKHMDGPDGPMVQGFVQDMTAKRGERIASARLAAVVDAADYAIIGTDLECNITDWNAGATRLFGYERTEVLGRSILDVIVPAERRDEAVRVRAAVASGERVPRFETVRLCKEGKVIHTSVMISPIISATGEVIGSTAVDHDIADELAAEEARVRVELQAAEATRMKALEGFRRTFISQASHELNTPLTPMRIHIEALGERTDLTPEQRNHVVVIERNTLRLASLVRDMLEASRLETGRFELAVEDVPLVTLINESLESLAEMASKAGVTLGSGRVTRLLAHVDRNRVSQVLFNLLSNAISFTPKGGRITVTATLETGQAVVRITDTGVGLSAAQIGQLFQPFSRPHEGLGSAAKGTGLGLFISKGIIEQHGGRIWADSQGPGAGSSFCFSLPLAQGARERIRPARETPAQGHDARVTPKGGTKTDLETPTRS